MEDDEAEEAEPEHHPVEEEAHPGDVALGCEAIARSDLVQAGAHASPPQQTDHTGLLDEGRCNGGVDIDGGSKSVAGKFVSPRMPAAGRTVPSDVMHNDGLKTHFERLFGFAGEPLSAETRPRNSSHHGVAQCVHVDSSRGLTAGGKLGASGKLSTHTEDTPAPCCDSQACGPGCRVCRAGAKELPAAPVKAEHGLPLKATSGSWQAWMPWQLLCSCEDNSRPPADTSFGPTPPEPSRRSPYPHRSTPKNSLRSRQFIEAVEVRYALPEAGVSKELWNPLPAKSAVAH